MWASAPTVALFEEGPRRCREGRTLSDASPRSCRSHGRRQRRRSSASPARRWPPVSATRRWRRPRTTRYIRKRSYRRRSPTCSRAPGLEQVSRLDAAARHPRNGQNMSSDPVHGAPRLGRARHAFEHHLMQAPPLGAPSARTWARRAAGEALQVCGALVCFSPKYGSVVFADRRHAGRSSRPRSTQSPHLRRDEMVLALPRGGVRWPLKLPPPSTSSASRRSQARRSRAQGARRWLTITSL